jgi:hypothetical protein
MSYLFLAFSPKTAPMEAVLDPNSAYNKILRQESFVANKAPELVLILREAYLHARAHPDVYIDENGRLNIPWANAAGQILREIDESAAAPESTV